MRISNFFGKRNKSNKTELFNDQTITKPIKKNQLIS
jgi:hypothetical protein